jgi:toxin ParE1/3/4
MHYLLTTAAKEDLSELFLYVNREFGVQKAKEAILNIQKTIEELEAFPDLGMVPRYRSLRLQGYRFLIVEKHYVFYKIINNAVTIIRIIHQKQSLFLVSNLSYFESILEGIKTPLSKTKKINWK